MVINEKTFKAWNQVTSAYMAKGDYDKALHYWYKFLEEAEESQDALLQSHIYNSIGGIYLKKKDWDRALELRQKAFTLREELGFSPWVAESYNDLAILYHAMKNYSKAIDFYEKALEILELDLHEERRRGWLYYNMACTLYQLEHWERAELMFLKSRLIFRNLNQTRPHAQVLYNLGMVHLASSNYTKAEPFFQESLACFEFLGDKRLIANCEKSLGDTFFFQKQSARAMFFYRKCERELERSDLENYAELKHRYREIDRF